MPQELDEYYNVGDWRVAPRPEGNGERSYHVYNINTHDFEIDANDLTSAIKIVDCLAANAE